MRDFEKIDWKHYNKPPYLQQWLCGNDTYKLATFGDKRLEGIDDQILILKDQWDLDNASGHALDRIGQLLDEKRNGHEDGYYRTLLKLKILLNTNDGTVPSIIKSIKYLHNAKTIEIVPRYPAGLSITHDGEDLLRDIVRIIDAIIPAGVGCEVIKLLIAPMPLYFASGAILDDIITLKTDITGKCTNDDYAAIMPIVDARYDVQAQDNESAMYLAALTRVNAHIHILAEEEVL